jgi:hypothetical protein
MHDILLPLSLGAFLAAAPLLARTVYRLLPYLRRSQLAGKRGGLVVVAGATDGIGL